MQFHLDSDSASVFFNGKFRQVGDENWNNAGYWQVDMANDVMYLTERILFKVFVIYIVTFTPYRDYNTNSFTDY